MLNTLDDYIGHSLPEQGKFTTNSGLGRKVSPGGSFLPFRGNTAVFLLDGGTRRALRGLQDELYAAAPDMLAERLGEGTFHMTLHDLANGVPGEQGLEGRMRDTEAKARELLRMFGGPPLRMRATRLFNMVNTSIVLGLKPADGDSWRRIDGMYTSLEQVVTLGYALTPHITMAYFRPGTYGREQVDRLAAALRAVELELTLDMGALVLQSFGDMNNYETLGAPHGTDIPR